MQTNSANCAVWCAGVILLGRISYKRTLTPILAMCQAASEPASPAPITFTVGVDAIQNSSFLSDHTVDSIEVIIPEKLAEYKQSRWLVINVASDSIH